MCKTNIKNQVNCGQFPLNSEPTTYAISLPMSPSECLQGKPATFVISFYEVKPLNLEKIFGENTAAILELAKSIKALNTKQANTEAPNSEVTDNTVTNEVQSNPPIDEAPAISDDEMKLFVRQMIDNKGAPLVGQVFKSFGKERLSDFDSSQYPELKARLEA